jgi:hypothetical protein
MVVPAMSLVPMPPPELQFGEDDRPADICGRLVGFVVREASSIGTRRFFANVAIALGRAPSRESGEDAGAELARELARHARDPWVRDGIDRGFDLFSSCIDETGRRCVAALVAEYLGWREPPDPFFHRVGAMFMRRGAAELVRLARVTAAYARLPKPSPDEDRLLAAVPGRCSRPAPTRRLTILGFTGEPRRESVRSNTEVPSLGSDDVLGALGSAGLGLLANDDTLEVPLVGRPLLWFPSHADHDLRRLHLLLAGAIA